MHSASTLGNIESYFDCAEILLVLSMSLPFFLNISVICLELFCFDQFYYQLGEFKKKKKKFFFEYSSKLFLAVFFVPM